MSKKAHVKIQGKDYEGIVVPVNESIERWTDVKLEDGTEIRLKPVITDVVRVPGLFDADDQPTYLVKSTNVMTVAAPESLAKRAKDPSTTVQ